MAIALALFLAVLMITVCIFSIRADRKEQVECSFNFEVLDKLEELGYEIVEFGNGRRVVVK